MIVDEVLGSRRHAEFQQRCLGKMQDVARSGRTVLFVSHNMAAVEALCEKAILLEDGCIRLTDDVSRVVRTYCQMTLDRSSFGGHSLIELGVPRRKHRVFEYVEVLDGDGNPTGIVPLGDALRLRLQLRTPRHVEQPTIGLGFDDALGQRVLTIHTPRTRSSVSRVVGECTVECTIPRLPLAPGDFWVKLAFSANGEELDVLDRAFCIRIAENDAFGDGRGFTRGTCIAESDWALLEPETPSRP